jgi:ribosomal protein S18 acetylase RimI-like enzyme
MLIPGKLIFRPMTVKDYEAACQLWKKSSGIGLRSLDDSKEGIRKFLERNPNTCFAAENAGELIGVILCGHDGRRGTIYHLAVEVSNRRKAVGQTLVGLATEALRVQNIHKVSLVVFASNKEARTFWTSIGFAFREDLVYFDNVLNMDNH